MSNRPAPLPPAAAGGQPCTDSPAGRVLCDPAGTTSGWVDHALVWLGTYWPLLAALAFIGGVMAVVVVSARAQLRWTVAGRATWLEITPPPTLPAGGALAGWQVIAGALTRTARRSRGWLRVAPVVAVELCADYSGLRAGVWVPASLAPQRVADSIEHAWPGAKVRPGIGPDWQHRPVSAVELHPTGGVWAPLIDPAPRAPRSPGEITEDTLRAVFAALARRGPGEQAVVQLLVTSHRRAALARGAALGMGAVLRAVVALVELLLPGRHHPPRNTAVARRLPTDPAKAAAIKATDTKRASGPHLRATLRVAVASVGVRGPARHRLFRRQLVTNIAAGYDLTTTTRLGARRLWVAPGRLATRAMSGGFMATLPELAVLWHLPAEPSRYGMAEITARTRPPAWGLPRIHPTPPAGQDTP